MFDVYFYGPMRVILDNESGEVLGVQDRISGASADFTFSPSYILEAKRFAQRQYEASREYA